MEALPPGIGLSAANQLQRLREVYYQAGARDVWRELLRQSIRELGQEGKDSGWAVERADVVAQLRMLCAEFGDNEWPDDLHLGDVIDKHLGRHLWHSGLGANGT